MSGGIGIPIKLLHECEGYIISIETVAGEVFRGQLKNAEDTMNVQMEQVQYTNSKGKIFCFFSS
jgi:small nuclear ribonucleoprotein D3